MTNLDQIFAPVTIAITYFSMPQDVIPFDMNLKSFAIVLFLTVVMVQVMFSILRRRLTPSPLKRFFTWMKTLRFGETVLMYLQAHSWRMKRRRHSPSSGDIEMVSYMSA
jgi:hypothetical protein